jgi:hypothetical protein
MAVPATTGVLRTKVSDMEIGDYIVASASLEVSGTPLNRIYDLGTSGIVNITNAYQESYTGFAAPQSKNPIYYFIKCAKGLLIADRVVQHSLTWDATNTGKLIQGLPWDNGNIIPTMTSNTAPSGVASASDGQSAAYRLFDKVTNAIGRIASTSGWWSYLFPSPTVIRGYAFRGSIASSTNNPKNWTFEGSNDGVTWQVLDTRTNMTYSADYERKMFVLQNKASFTYYRMNISQVNGGTSIDMAELEMMDTAGIIRSLTGGVAYADANGNSSNSNLSLGAFPTNNEWEKYIVNFPIDKIQSGKTLDDVFHWSGIYTWCQDTPALAISPSTSRRARGNSSSSWTANNTSSASNVAYGFRPVFEYKEE